MLLSGPGFLSVRLIEGVPLIGGPLHRGFTVFTCQVLRTFCVAQNL